MRKSEHIMVELMFMHCFKQQENCVGI